jgi:hypothetical protein
VSEPRRQPRAGVAVGRVELGLGKEQAPGEISASQVGAPEVGSCEVGQTEVGMPEVSANEAGSSEVGAPEIGGVQAGADKVGSPAVQLLPRNLGAHKFARLEQQNINLAPVPLDIQV